MTALTATAFNVLNNLAITLGVEPRFASGSGDAASDVNGWLGSVLADTNNSPQLIALRASLKASLGSNVALTEADLFSYYFQLLSASPATIWGANLLEWCRADLGSSATSFPDQSGNALGYAGTCTPTATDATLNNLATISTDGATQTLTSAINLPRPSARPTTEIAVVKLGAFSAPSFLLDSGGLNFMAMGPNSATQARFKNAGTSQLVPAAATTFSFPGNWCLWAGSWSASASDARFAGTFQRAGSLLDGTAGAAGRVMGATGQQVQWFEVIHLGVAATARDLWIYKGYLDALTANGVLHT